MLKVVEGVAGIWHYHISESGETYKPALCGKKDVLTTSMRISSWGFKSHLNETYCKECEEHATKNYGLNKKDKA